MGNVHAEYLRAIVELAVGKCLLFLKLISHSCCIFCYFDSFILILCPETNLNEKGLVVEIGEGKLTDLLSKYMYIPSTFLFGACACMSLLFKAFLIELRSQVIS